MTDHENSPSPYWPNGSTVAEMRKDSEKLVRGINHVCDEENRAGRPMGPAAAANMLLSPARPAADDPRVLAQKAQQHMDSEAALGRNITISGAVQAVLDQAARAAPAAVTAPVKPTTLTKPPAAVATPSQTAPAMPTTAANAELQRRIEVTASSFLTIWPRMSLEAARALARKTIPIADAALAKKARRMARLNRKELVA